MQESSGQSGWVLKEHDYINLSEVSSAFATMNQPTADAECPLQDTDLRLGLGLGLSSGFLVKQSTKEAEARGEKAKDAQVPKLVSAGRESRYPSSFAEFHRGLAPPTPKNGMKRGYSEAMAIADARYYMMGAETRPAAIAMAALKNAEADVKNSPKHKQQSSFFPFAPSKTAVVAGAFKPHDSSEKFQEPATDDAPPPKGQVVGWPPVRSYRRQTLAKPAEMFVKVNMDRVTVGRKVDLNAYFSYESLLRALEEMFQPSKSAQGAAPQAPSGRENDLKHFLLSSCPDFVLTYEDKDGDWMLVGDVPWSMFISTVRRLRITRGSEANGPAAAAAAPRGQEKSRFHV